MTYEQGFSDGERFAFEDRRNRTQFGHYAVLGASADESPAYWRGFRDGYVPRSAGWGAGVTRDARIQEAA